MAAQPFADDNVRCYIEKALLSNKNTGEDYS